MCLHLLAVCLLRGVSLVPFFSPPSTYQLQDQVRKPLLLAFQHCSFWSIWNPKCLSYLLSCLHQPSFFPIALTFMCVHSLLHLFKTMLFSVMWEIFPFQGFHLSNVIKHCKRAIALPWQVLGGDLWSSAALGALACVLSSWDRIVGGPGACPRSRCMWLEGEQTRLVIKLSYKHTRLPYSQLICFAGSVELPVLSVSQLADSAGKWWKNRWKWKRDETHRN